MTDEKSLNLAKGSGVRLGGGQWTCKTKMTMEARIHALCGGLGNQKNKQKPFGSVGNDRRMMQIMMNHCSKTRGQKTSPKARRQVNSSLQCIE